MEEFSILSVFLQGLKGIFGTPAGFVVGFFAKLVLLFSVSALISKIFHLEKAYDHTVFYPPPSSEGGQELNV